MSEQLRERIFEALEQIPLVDPHTHINPRAAASETLADILGYHYFTELAHSAGLARERIEEPGISPKEKVARLVPQLQHLENTVQYSWFLEICREFFDFEDERVTESNWETLYDRACQKMSQPDWEHQVLRKSRLEQVYLTNDFDDPLEGFDRSIYVPCLRTDELVFHLSDPSVRERLEKTSGVAVSDAATLRQAIGQVFEHFVTHDARACAISLPPDFTPRSVSDAEADFVLQSVLRNRPVGPEHLDTLRCFVFWTVVQFCADNRLPFDLMIGVIRKVYPAGVFQGMDLYDQRVSLHQYARLFNAFPQVVFPVSVLSHFSNQELVSYSWIFPNVVTSGHWWYSNVPSYIEPDLRSRLQAVPRNKQIGYYSDMYKLEFALPKFRMYRRVLAKVLAEEFVLERGWSEERAVALGRQVLRENVDRIFSR